MKKSECARLETPTANVLHKLLGFKKSIDNRE